MPWTAADAPKHNADTKDKPHLAKIWVAAANDALKEYKDDGKAIAVANAAVDKAKKDGNGKDRARPSKVGAGQAGDAMDQADKSDGKPPGKGGATDQMMGKGKEGPKGGQGSQPKETNPSDEKDAEDDEKDDEADADAAPGDDEGAPGNTGGESDALGDEDESDKYAKGGKRQIPVITLNQAGADNAKDLVRAGAVNDGAWAFDADKDGDDLLGNDGDDWDTYSKFHLGEDTSENDDDSARYYYPFGKGGEVYVAALQSIRERAREAGAATIEDYARNLLDSIAAEKARGEEKRIAIKRGLIGPKDDYRQRAIVLKAPSSFDPESREIEAVVSTGMRVRRRDWDGEFDEVLGMKPENVRMARLNQGAAVLDSHNWFDGLRAMLGGIVPGSARLTNGELSARIKFSRGSDLAQRVMQDLQDGIQIPLSAGYKVHKSETDGTTNPVTRTATDWEPIEVSLVPVAAEESGTGFRSRGEQRPRRAAGSNRRAAMTRPRRLPGEQDAEFKARISEWFKANDPIENESAGQLAKRVDEYFGEVKGVEDQLSARDEAEKKRAREVDETLRKREERRFRGLPEDEDDDDDAEGMRKRGGEFTKEVLQVSRLAKMTLEEIERTMSDPKIRTINDFRDAAFLILARKNGAETSSINGEASRMGTTGGSYTGGGYGEISTGDDPTVARNEAMAEALSIRLLSARREPAVLTKDHRDWCETRQIVDQVARSIRVRDGKEPPKNAQAREYLQLSIVEIAAYCIGHRFRNGIMRPADGYDILQKAWTRAGAGMHSQGDFPGIFQNALNKSLLARYQVAMPTYREIAAERTFNDFRPHPQVRAGDFPQPMPLTETGELKFGTAGESKESVSVLPYGVAFSISRQMLVNDDLGGIDQILGATGNSVLRFENATFFAMLLSNPGLLQDSLQVFKLGVIAPKGAPPVGHNNFADIAANGSGPPSITSISAGRAALRGMQTIDGQYLNLNATLILTGPVQETPAEQMITTITPFQVSSVNPFQGKLRNVTDAFIPGLNWYLFVDPAILPCFVYGFLAGAGGPRVRTEEPFGVQGVRVSLEHDFGVGAIDYRGAYLNSGSLT